MEELFALADQLEVRLAKARGQVDALTPFWIKHSKENCETKFN
jgi:hypothetical protein